MFTCNEIRFSCRVLYVLMSAWSHVSITENAEQFHHWKLPLLFVPIQILPQSPKSAKNWPIVLPFPECSINENLQYVAFYIWLLSLSKMNLIFLYIIICFESLFSFMLSNILLYDMIVTVCLATSCLKNIWVVSNYCQL